MKRSLVAVVVLLTLLAACGGYGAPKETPTAVPPAAGKPGEVAVTARYGSFTPSDITVKQGESVTVKLTSADVGHTFTIQELGINIQVGSGQTVTREIKIDRAGTYTFYCAVLGHRAAGMEGTLKTE
ncbi:MAG: cupredoxin domain-containing protein [Chloroflexi bacterium]|nr:cupredoxin domain-containing protein [Chloroflexota bacterium]